MKQLLPALLFFLPAVNPTHGQNANPDIEKLPSLAWKFQAAAGIVSAPVIDQNMVYFGSLDRKLYAVDKNSGKKKWHFQGFGPIRSVVCIDGDSLYLLSGDGNLYCVDKNNGKQIWRFRTQTGYTGDRLYDFADYYHSSPVLYKGTIYFGSGDGNVYAVSTAGELVWRFETGDVVHTVPALYQDKLFIGSYDGHVYSLNNRTGALLWKFKTTGQRYFPRGEVMGNPVVAGGLVLVGARDFNFYALDVNGGYCHWMKTFPRGWALPVTPNDTVIYLGTSDDRKLLALDPKTGETRWQTDAGFNIFGTCALSRSMGYFGTLMGKIQAINLKDGAVRWTFSTEAYQKNRLSYFKEDDDYRDDIGDLLPYPEKILDLYAAVGSIFSQPAIDGALLIFTGYDGSVYCLKEKK